ncbi:MAG: FG-GAP repeat domain-containing protein [Bryobacteraceae bacterium]
MKFTDVTEEAGVPGAGYSMGVAAGDFDNDGRVDLFVAGVYRNIYIKIERMERLEDVKGEIAYQEQQMVCCGPVGLTTITTATRFLCSELR